MKRVEVVAGIIEYNNKILCTQRDKGKVEEVSFKWEFPGGKIEEGETREDALKRELSEELDLEVEILNHFCDVTHDYPTFTIVMHCYLCKSSTDKVNLNVHKAYQWLKIDELELLDWAPADMPIVKKLINK